MIILPEHEGKFALKCSATHSVSTGKKNLLTFSATTSACLKPEQKRKEKKTSENDSGWILSGCCVSAMNHFKVKKKKKILLDQSPNTQFESLFSFCLSCAFAFFFFFYIFYFTPPVTHACFIISCVWLRWAVSKWENGDNISEWVVYLRCWHYLFLLMWLMWLRQLYFCDTEAPVVGVLPIWL